MAWDGPILTDSGGFQVFSLAELRKITEEGVEFRSPLDGSTHVLLRRSASIEIQHALGADICMALDECLAVPGHARARRALAGAAPLRWAAAVAGRARAPGAATRRCSGSCRAASYADLRARAARRETVALGFDGYAIGGWRSASRSR